MAIKRKETRQYKSTKANQLLFTATIETTTNGTGNNTWNFYYLTFEFKDTKRNLKLSRLLDFAAYSKELIEEEINYMIKRYDLIAA